MHVLKTGVIIGLFMLLCGQALGQVVVNADGTHSIQHGPHIINPNGTISVQHGPHIIHSDGAISVQHGPHTIQPNGTLSVSHGLNIINSDGSNSIKHEETPQSSSTITVSNNRKFIFSLHLGSAADRLERLDVERKTRKEDRILKNKLIRLWQSVTPPSD